jgi:NDP-sugar pyrophosphorylase family protein
VLTSSPSDNPASPGRHADVVGLIPMAGQAKRLSPSPCSKEIYPIEIDVTLRRPKVAAEYLIDKMKLAGITNVFVILRKGKWDIAEYFGDGSLWGMHFAYLQMGLPYGPPYSMDQAYSFLSGRRVAFGFADILFEPDDAFTQLLDRQAETDADVVLGLIHPENPSDWDMVTADADGNVRDILLKPTETDLSLGWICAVWTPAFTEFQHAFLATGEARRMTRESAASRLDAQGDLPVGAVLQNAVRDGLRVNSVRFENARYVDMGTISGLTAALRRHRQ